MIIALGSAPLVVAEEPVRERPLPPYRLEDLYQLTLQQSEQLKLRREDIRIAEAQYRQAISLVYPWLSLDANQRFRDNADFGRVTRRQAAVDDPATPIGGSGGALGRTQFDVALNLTQPLFNGFRDYLLSSAVEQEMEALRFELERDRELLYYDVAELYHQILLAGEELAVLERAERTLQERIKELQHFLELGKSRESEMIAARSDMEDLRALKEQSRGTLRATQELLAFLVGLPAEELKLAPAPVSEPRRPIDHYLTRAKERSDLDAARVRVAAQEQRLKAAQREGWPRLNLVGNAYPYEDPDRTREWEALLQLSIPLFEGGRIAARAAEEAARLRAVSLRADEQRRLSERQVRVAYARVESAERELESLRKLREAAERNYQSQRRDYEFGVVTNLDVLQAFRQLQEAERRVVRAEHLLQVNTAELEVAAGGVIE